jgi:hypothetical protein
MSTQAPGVIPASVHHVAPWCSEADIPTGRITDSNGDVFADVQIGFAICAATDLLYVLSGRQWRSGHTVMRPCAMARAIAVGSMVYPWGSMSGFGSAWGFPGGWMWSAGFGFGGLGFTQGSDATEVVLQGPVTNIEEVLLNGQTLDPSTDYHLSGRQRLTLNSGLGWPWQQDPQEDPTQPGTAQVIYDWGSSPPEIGRMACVELTIELILGLSGQDACKLPSRVVSIASQGVTVSLGDALNYILQDLTALPICDMFLQGYNPGKRRRRAVIVGPNTIWQRTS